MAHDNTIRVLSSNGFSNLCVVRISDTCSVLKGELDVFIQAASGRFFEKITAQKSDHFIDYKNPTIINACTWHGNYIKDDTNVLQPKIHLKSSNKKVAWTLLDGVIEQANVFLFPVFSLYVPKNFNSGQQKKSKGSSQKLKIKSGDVRIDYFILPKHIEKDDFLKLTVAKFALEYDIAMYNRQMRGVLLPLYNCDVDFHWYKLGSWWCLIRCVYPRIVRIEKYWLYFHDTFDPISCILNRGYSPMARPNSIQNDDSISEIPKEKLSLRDLYENELKNMKMKS